MKEKNDLLNCCYVELDCSSCFLQFKSTNTLFELPDQLHTNIVIQKYVRKWWKVIQKKTPLIQKLTWKKNKITLGFFEKKTTNKRHRGTPTQSANMALKRLTQQEKVWQRDLLLWL